MANIGKSSHTSVDDDIVISGISGRYPESNDIHQLRDNLMSKLDMITSDGRRWNLVDPHIPQRTGKINDIHKFDAKFFGIHAKQVEAMDPLGRVLLEHAYEAVIDAGVNPQQLRGSNTGVFTGSNLTESEKTWLYEKLRVNGFGITGCSRSMLANRISYYMGATGPSLNVDTACSSTLTAMEQAYQAIKNGRCDAAIVGGGNLCLHPYVSMQFYKLGVLSKDGRCKTFDTSADGYVRSETASVLFLQKAKDAKRRYATLVHAKVNCDGYKEEGITFPSTQMQSQLLRDFYRECALDASLVSYVEAHGTGTRVGDPEEVNAIDKAMCQNRPAGAPLLIGSVKSNLGHTEPASGLVSLAKVIIAMESGQIPANLHFKQCKPELTAILEGRMKVVDETTAWDGGYAAVNSFGFGGANAHVLLRSNDKDKVNGGAPEDDLERLVCVSGRTEQAVSHMLAELESKAVDAELVALLHGIHSSEISGHLYRGYSLLPARGIADKPVRSVEAASSAARPVCFVFSGMGSQWPGMGEALMRIPVFAQAIDKCHVALQPFGIDVRHVITNKDATAFDNIMNSFVGIAAIQIGLVDVLFSLGIKPDQIIGHSVGEMGCAYADGCISLEQMILSVYSRGLASVETTFVRGSMAAVGLGYQQLKDMCPPDIEVACHNSTGSATISGPADSIKHFVAELQAKNIFVREVACSHIAYHSRYVAPAAPKLLAYLRRIIPEPKARSAKWLSTSVAMDEWDSDSARYLSAEYLANNFLSPVLFEETSALIAKDAIAIEIAPHGLLQAILRRALDDTVCNLPLALRGRDGVQVLLQAVGKMFNLGLHPQISNLYPAVEFPVSRATPMISPLIKWEHSDNWFVTSYKSQEKLTSSVREVKISLQDNEYESLAGHIIDGRNLLPATGYLFLIWETLGMMRGEMYTELPVVFQNIKFLRATNIPKNGHVELTLMIHRGSGHFEIVEGDSAVVNGYARLTNHPNEEKSDLLQLSIDNGEDLAMTSDDVYKELRIRGYQYTGVFRGIKRASTTGSRGHIAWQHDWAAFMDNMLQITILATDNRGLFVPTAIDKIVIDSVAHLAQIEFGDTGKEFEVMYDKHRGVINCGGVQISGTQTNAISRRKAAREPVIEEYKFVASTDGVDVCLRDIARLATQIALENRAGIKVKTIELIDEADSVSSDQLLSPWFSSSFEDLPSIQADICVLSTTNYWENETSMPANFSLIDPKKANKAHDCFLAVGHRLLTSERVDHLNLLLDELEPAGFLLTRENRVKDIDRVAQAKGLNVILVKNYGRESMLLLRKREKLPRDIFIVQVSNDSFDWLGSMRKTMSENVDKEKTDGARIIFVAQGDFESGLMGLVNALRRELGGQLVRAIFIQDPKAPPFSLENSLYAEQVQKDLTVSVLREGAVWGTYRHLPLGSLQPKAVQHRYVNQLTRGDMSSLKWIEGPIDPKFSDSTLVRIVYAPLNFRDVMLTSGKLATETIASMRQTQDCVLGYEYSGVAMESGKRVMGTLKDRGLSNLCHAIPAFTWDVPENWSLEDAATVPCVYATCIYALYIKGSMEKGDKILIHAGSGGVGQAAINLALAEGCEVFTTVGTAEKRRFIREHFPQISDDHIGDSRSTKFIDMIAKMTNNRGVDIVLNSLSEDKLIASVDCLARNGRFLEIGKFDIAANNPLGMKCFEREISFQGVMLNSLYEEGSMKTILLVHKLLNDYLKSGAIKPLVRTVFADNQVEEALRYMAAGRHIGKVLIKVRNEKNLVDCSPLALPRYHCLEDKSYIILGGLGGFGLELADWMVLRGAKNLILTSRKGVTSGYQKMRIDLWKSYGVNVQIVCKDASSYQDCQSILEEAAKLAPVDGIFNLAVVLMDALWENQTHHMFEESFKPKARATKNLDALTRKLCPELRHFVVFSSASCGRGNAGQTNYAMANSVMERICEKRVIEGLPGLAIQWGAIADVGLVAAMQMNDQELAIGGTLQQRISSCLQELDGFLHQRQAVVSSMVVAEKNSGKTVALNLVETVLGIIGLKDMRGVSTTTSLAGLGADSMMVVEIKQTLEREFDIFLTAPEIRALTFSRLQEMMREKID